jgi:hypothetical protein
MVAGLKPELADRVKAQLFALDLEKDLEDDPKMMEREFTELVTLIVRESLKRDLQRLGKQVAASTNSDPELAELKKAYSSKTEALTQLEEDANL